LRTAQTGGATAFSRTQNVTVGKSFTLQSRTTRCSSAGRAQTPARAELPSARAGEPLMLESL
jgi:hypothetical protein